MGKNIELNNKLKGLQQDMLIERALTALLQDQLPSFQVDRDVNANLTMASDLRSTGVMSWFMDYFLVNLIACWSLTKVLFYIGIWYNPLVFKNYKNLSVWLQYIVWLSKARCAGHSLIVWLMSFGGAVHVKTIYSSTYMLTTIPMILWLQTRLLVASIPTFVGDCS